MLNCFESYTDLGLQVIPLYPKTKVPIGVEWNSDWDKERFKTIFKKNQNANMGIILGDVVDVEGDNEESNEFLANLIGNYPHPVYKGSKSFHHLFLNPDPSLTRITVGKIEFRGHKHQSVIPPSIHPDGTPYVWIAQVFPIPVMPQTLLKFYQEIPKPKEIIVQVRRKFPRDYIKIWCSNCGKKISIHKKRLKLEKEAFASLGRIWSCQKCRNVDLRAICKQLKRQ